MHLPKSRSRRIQSAHTSLLWSSAIFIAASISNAAEQTISESPLAPRHAQTEEIVLFEHLTPESTGVDFENSIDITHPLKRLYPSGYANGGVAVGDVNGDGKPDLYLVSGPGENKLYLQGEPFEFEDVTAQAGVGGGDDTWGTGAAMVDIDNDGDLDIYVANYDSPNQLYLNEGDGKFREAASEYGLDISDASLMAYFADYDKDGDLDVYIVTNRFYREGGIPSESQYNMGFFDRGVIKPEYEKYYTFRKIAGDTFTITAVGRPDYLLRNDGERFTDVTKEAGIADEDHGLSAVWVDYNSDGYPDLYVANDFTDADRLYHNNGDGTFTDKIADVVPHTTWFSMGSDVGDVNNDGLLDIFVLDMAATSHYREKASMGNMDKNKEFLLTAVPRQVMRNALLINAGNGKMLEAAKLAGVSSTDWSWSANFGDLDNDGLIDLFVTNGMTRDYANSDMSFEYEDNIGKTRWDHFEDTDPRPEQNRVFWNKGDYKFEDASELWGLDHMSMSYGAAYADFDRDGDLDLVYTNVDEPVSILRNNSSGDHSVLVKLIGTDSNKQGIGAHVSLTAGGHQQIRALHPMTGFVSSSDPVIHFGLGDAEKIDQLEITWPSGNRQVFKDLPADRLFTIIESETTTEPEKAEPITMAFRSSDALIKMVHEERDYDDFKDQPLLPNKLSQLGPGMAWGDIDGDGDDDVYLGGAAGQAGMLGRNAGNGEFTRSYPTAILKDRKYEDMGALFFDADGDGDLDLYVVSGGVEHGSDSKKLQDRLYLNDGEGSFAKAPEGTLPDLRDSGGTVAAADFDRDGDLDLFVGSRVIPGEYPLAPKSRLLLNEGGRFIEVKTPWSESIANAGMVTGALWSDADNDGWVDLFLTIEWGPVRFFRNQNGKLEEDTQAAGLADRVGWYNGITGGDVDGDGDIDYVVTNFGLNSKYKATPKKPELLFYGDMDDSGRKRIIEAKFEKEICYPRRGLSCSSQAIPSIRDRLPTFHQFASSTLNDIYGDYRLDKAERFEANSLETGILINDGKGHFSFTPLPRLAQISPSYGVVIEDLDADGFADIVLAQNFFNPQAETGRMDGGLSLFLKGNGDGTFKPLMPYESGIVVPADAKGLALIDLNQDKQLDLVFSANDSPAYSFINENEGGREIIVVTLKDHAGNPSAIGARVTALDETLSPKVAEIRSSGGYLSQENGVLYFTSQDPEAVARVQVRWPDGEESVHEISSSSDNVIVHPRGSRKPDLG
ncbi:FG-GAP-like repeat-containing protein [Rubellicoccus peritrichatus]|uniref:FG-GAP-like repeat-containing protein n=1 Tax=Rubellicoccus peritrichatus TaxID=3080537 RepID=A0AAQ3L7Y6_9BACT|nr:FG-GAP-like repeat-containing protein [Puniceicoccus sp. CR14]WOO40940.1 FG-GAP-like repeat-containing protein [Puniceicoccus sp. CR14]